MTTTLPMSRNAVMEMQTSLENTRAAKRELKKEVEAPTSMTHVAAAGSTLGGAAAAGVIRAVAGDEVAGVPTDVAAGLVTGALGLGLGNPNMVHAGVGMLAPFVSNAVEAAVADYRGADDDDSEEGDE